MKRISLLACTFTACAASTLVSAAITGPYVGIGLGESQVKTPDSYAFVVSADPNGSASRSRNGFAGRAFGGVNFNKWVGLEAGYTRYARSSYNGTASGASASLRYYIRSYDIVAKGYIPLGDSGFNVYGLAGVARVIQTEKYTNNGVPTSGNIMVPPSSPYHVYRNRPIYGLGLNYSFMRHFTMAVEATQIHHENSFSKTLAATPYIDFYSLSLAYNFC